MVLVIKEQWTLKQLRFKEEILTYINLIEM